MKIIHLPNETHVMNLCEMAKVGEFNKEGKFIVFIMTDDGGNIPHFHIWDYSTRGDKFSTCICITEPKYFHHPGKMDILNSKQLKALVKLLKGPSINKRYTSSWEYLVSMWNDNNSKIYVPEDIEMPDYLNNLKTIENVV